MNVLVLGSGGREHALSWIVSKSNLCSNLFIAPGNSGTSQVGQNIAMDPNDFEKVGAFCLEQSIDLVIVGPEDPIVNGIFNYFKNDQTLKHINVLAPSMEAGQLEGSKDFAKMFMQKHNIPTAKYATFTSEMFDEAKAYIISNGAPIVIKADGLAAGKGVTVAFSTDQAIHALEDLFLNNRFGQAGDKVVIEEYLDGIELSMFVLTDGKNHVLLPEAKDYKRIGEGDTGPNTGGMGAISPVPFATAEFIEKVKAKIILPTLHGLQNDHLTFNGFIFFGLMNVNGEPYVIEYNVRLGDPETEAILPRIESDFLELMYKASKGEMDVLELKISNQHAATVMLVSEGYPNEYEKNKEISGLSSYDNSILFHAGAKDNDGKVVSSGGRVLAVTSLGENMEIARTQAYQVAENIKFDNKYYRKDIGKDLLSF